MTEKRFMIDFENECITDTFTNEDYCTLIDLKTILNNLHEEKECWKKRVLLLESKYNEGDSIEWLRNNTVWEQMPTNQKTYTTTDMKMTYEDGKMIKQRFFILKDEKFNDVLPCIRDRNTKINDIYGHYKHDNLEEICNELNRLEQENKHLKQQLSSINQLIDKKIEEYLNIPSLSDGALTALKELKKELKGDE